MPNNPDKQIKLPFEVQSGQSGTEQKELSPEEKFKDKINSLLNSNAELGIIIDQAKNELGDNASINRFRDYIFNTIHQEVGFNLDEEAEKSEPVKYDWYYQLKIALLNSIKYLIVDLPKKSKIFKGRPGGIYSSLPEKDK